MAPRNRPSALDVSFGLQPESGGSSGSSRPGDITRSSSVASSTSSLGKRRGTDDEEHQRAAKRPKGALYHPPTNLTREDEHLIVEGEDPYHEEGDNDDDDRSDSDSKPIRQLYDFTFFDPNKQNEMVTLDELELNDGVDRHFEAVGRVKAHFLSEDDGMEDELYGDDDEDQDDVVRDDRKGKGRVNAGSQTADRRKRREQEKPEEIRLSAILRYTVDYTKDNEPVYVETTYAWYILMTPSEGYQDLYKYFQFPRRITQLVVSGALKRPRESYANFLDRFTSRVDMFGHTYTEKDLLDSVDVVRGVAYSEPELATIANAPFVKYILERGKSNGQPTPSRIYRLGNKNFPMIKKVSGNPDLAVLKPENQNSTHVTPMIAWLCNGLFREEIEVVGPRLVSESKAQLEARRRKTFEKLKGWVEKVKRQKHVDYDRRDRVDVMNDWYKSIKIDNVTYNVGDVVLIPRALLYNEKIKVIPGIRVDHLFWYARIHYFLIGSQEVHVQWLYHSSQTIMDELSDPQELFLSHVCGRESLQKVVTKVDVAYFAKRDSLEPDEYFCRFYYDQTTCTFEQVPSERFHLLANQEVPENCEGCSVGDEMRWLTSPTMLTKNGQVHGIAFAGKQFHVDDFVTYRSIDADGICHIGQVVEIKIPRNKESAGEVFVKKVGRISGLMHIVPPELMVVKDERHLYLTEESDRFPATNLIDIIYVISYSSLQNPECTLQEWLDISYKHFYVRYTFPQLFAQTWRHRKRVVEGNFSLCSECMKGRLQGKQRLSKFLDTMNTSPLRVLDLFGGIGAFGHGIALGSGCLKVTHAIEISPSAARTFRKNFSDTVVHNQCANLILRHIIKAAEGHVIEPLYQIEEVGGKKVLLSPLPRTGQIDVIVAGFPCQSHSTLNMFKKLDDIKSNLILTTLSYVDHFRPKFVFFENVPGFVRFGLHADRANIHDVQGEVPKGGLKLLVRALVHMGYQLRFANLQAVHYGTPQGRSRFFLIGAKAGYPLPAFPQPTHHHPRLQDQAIKYMDSIGDTETEIKIDPIRSTPGVALHPYVTIEDAISDLPRFDWKHPMPNILEPEQRRKLRARADSIPVLECKKSDPWCGFSGSIGYYYDQPRTTFQLYARYSPTTNIQHFTKCLIPDKIARVLGVPLEANADYRDLPANLRDWYMSSTSSALARHGYRKGIYGRLDSQGIFGTTVTNVDPTAKQCHVLHPTQHRILSVRELARSQGLPDHFVFESIGNKIVTMHRQIGNAVPIPVGHALGRELRRSLFDQWISQQANVIILEDSDDEHEATSQSERSSMPPPPSENDDLSEIYE